MHSSATFLLAALASTALSSPLKTRDVPAGQVITGCTEPGTIAFTFDDGPSEYTSQLLDLLAEYDAQATFFVLGDTASGSADLLQRMQRESHQIGSHTYDHLSLITLSDAEIEAEMNRLDDVLVDLIEERPTYMRPPYFDVDDHVLQVLGNLGYKVITADIDTKDYENNGETQIDVSFNKFVDELDAGGSIVLSHDIHYWTVYKLTEEMLIEAQSRGLRAVTVGECLGDPLDEWYRQ